MAKPKLRRLATCSIFWVLWIAPLQAQTTATVSSAALWDSYTFDGGIDLGYASGLSSVSELSFPVTLSLPLGQRARVSLASGYTRVEMRDNAGARVVVAGPTDVEARFSIDVVPDRLSVFATGALPTGTTAINPDAAPLLSLLGTDVFSFSTRRLGTGGGAGIGVAGALPAGRLALGWAGSFNQFGGFHATAGDSPEVVPGSEVRLRLGLEGPLGRRTHLRLAGVYSRKASDKIGGELAPVPGQRISAYASLEQGVGSGTLTLYAFDSFRDAASVDITSVGPAVLPRGNLIAGGVHAVIPFGPSTSLAPRVDVRRSSQSADPMSSELQHVGTTVRFGAEVTRELGGGAAVVVEGGGVMGTVRSGLMTITDPELPVVSVRGVTAGVHLRWHW